MPKQAIILKDTTLIQLLLSIIILQPLSPILDIILLQSLVPSYCVKTYLTIPNLVVTNSLMFYFLDFF